MNHSYSHINFGFEVAEIQHSVEGAIDTILAFEVTISDLESRLKDLLRALKGQALEEDMIFAIFKLMAAMRFHFEEAAEYREILQRMAPAKARATS